MKECVLKISISRSFFDTVVKLDISLLQKSLKTVSHTVNLTAAGTLSALKNSDKT